jgi:hypothetical protein
MDAQMPVRIRAFAVQTFHLTLTQIILITARGQKIAGDKIIAVSFC